MNAFTTRWRRLMGCLKLQVIFRKRATKYRALLRKTTIKIGHPMGRCHPIHGCVCEHIHICALYTLKTAIHSSKRALHRMRAFTTQLRVPTYTHMSLTCALCTLQTALHSGKRALHRMRALATQLRVSTNTRTILIYALCTLQTALHSDK